MRLTVRDLLLEGEPLSPAQVLAGDEQLDNPVTWVVSLRPYMPAFPRMRGGELALVATENLARLDLPSTLSEVLQQLAKLDASAVAVKGQVDGDAIAVARSLDLPLIQLAPDAPVHDIEQAVMRECAMRSALSEVQPRTGSEWLAALLDRTGRAEVPTNLKQHVDASAHYAIAYIPVSQGAERTSLATIQERATAELNLLVGTIDGGLVSLVPAEGVLRYVERLGKKKIACGIGSARPLVEAPISFDEAKLAATASVLLRKGEPTTYASLGADRLLVLLDRDAPDELSGMVRATLGPLLDHDAQSGVPLRATLEEYLRHGGRLRETAAALYVHRNTLAYRLGRVEALLGVNLDNPDERLAVELALRALPLVTEHRRAP
jgi:hypothetical protein